MDRRVVILRIAVAAAACLAACGRSEPERPSAAPAQPAAVAGVQPPAVGVYVTNETSGDLTIIDAATASAIATIPLGKRPRGITASPDGTTVYVALSGSPV